MIYVLESAGFDENKNFIKLIKLGFTDNWTKRYATYLLHNPTIVPLFLIEGGDTTDEFSLRQYFQKYQYSLYGNEWFYYSEKILEFFSKNTTIEKIRESIPTLSSSLPLGKSVIGHVASIIGDVVLNVDYDQLVCELQSHKFIDISQVLCFIRDTYTEVADNIIDQIIAWYSIKRKLRKGIHVAYSVEEGQVLDFMYRLRKVESFYSQMELLCTEEFSETALPMVLNQLPVRIKRFYSELGPSECKRCGYNSTRMSIALNRPKLEKIIKEIVHKEFTVGNKYSLAEIKARLIDIYKNLGYKRHPKATDILDWLEVESTSFRINGKKVGGFLIIKKK